MSLQTILQLVGLLVYLAGTGLIIKFQKTKLDAVKTQLEAQNGMVANAERIVNIFRPEVTEGYVSIIQKKAALEKDEAIKKVNEEWKAKSDKGIHFLLEEMEAFLSFSMQVIYTQPNNVRVKMALDEMKDTETKKSLIESRERALKHWNEYLLKHQDDNSFSAKIIRMLFSPISILEN